MVQFNFSERTIKAKVVYYGPAQSGKTTNLEQIHRLTDPAGTNRLISLNTAQDRTLFFDLLPFNLGTVSGYDFKIQLYTVPGQVQYNATRRVVLAGADAVVFVADSRRSILKENIAAFENMKVNLLANRLVPEKLPLVIQYNKRDLDDILSVGELSQALNPWQRPQFNAVAMNGEGVLDTFVSVVEQSLLAIAVKYNLKEKGLDPSTVPELVAGAFKKLNQTVAQSPPAQAPAKVIFHQPPDANPSSSIASVSTEGGMVSEELLQRAIRSNVELATALGDLVRDLGQGLHTIQSHAELLFVYRDDAQDKRVGAIKSIHHEAARLQKILDSLGRPVPAENAPAPAGPALTPLSASQPTPVPARMMSVTAVRAPAVERTTFNGVLQAEVEAARAAYAARNATVGLQAGNGIAPPGCPLDLAKQAVSALLSAGATACASGAAILRCERKPVLLRSSSGEVRRDFIMVALAHNGDIDAAQQQRVIKGGDTGPFGLAQQLTKKIGGFLRFAPLPGGGMETRLFLPV